MKRKLIIGIILLSLTNLQAKDTMGVEMGLNLHSFDAEKLNESDSSETIKKQSNQNLNSDLYALIDFGKEGNFLVGPYFTASLTNNGQNPNSYDKITDYAPYGAGAVIRYELNDYSKFKNIGFQLKTGYLYSKIGTRKGKGMDIGVGTFYKLNHHWNIGVQGRLHLLKYNKNNKDIKVNINSVGIFISYDVF